MSFFCQSSRNSLEYAHSDDPRPSHPPSSASQFQNPVQCGGGGMGFLTCTEALGFESSDERAGGGLEPCVEGWTQERRGRRPPPQAKRRETRFPPLLPGLYPDGRPKSVLKAERKNGRFVLTEVRVPRPAETLCAERGGGRLRLYFVRPIEDVEEEERWAGERGVEGVGRWQCQPRTCHPPSNGPISSPFLTAQVVTGS